MNYDFNEAKQHLINSYNRLDPVITKGEAFIYMIRIIINI